jgi:hypothetical protein
MQENNMIAYMLWTLLMRPPFGNVCGRYPCDLCLKFGNNNRGAIFAWWHHRNSQALEWHSFKDIA